jgi:hypothetical protein
MTALLAQQISLIAATVLVALGVAVAWLARDALKRVGGLALLGFAAVAAAAALGSPRELLAGGAAVVFAQIVVGVAIVVRMREAYATTEVAEIDAADDASEPPGPAA